MSCLQVISINDNYKWDSIVRSFSKFDVYYLSGYVKAFYLHGDGNPYLFFYEDNQIKAINVVMHRDISKDIHFSSVIPVDTYFDLSTPYGYGGFLIEGNVNKDRLLCLSEEYNKFCLNNNIISEFVRFHPILKNSEMMKDIYEVSMLGKTIIMDIYSKDLIWDNLTSKNRNMIRKAQKSGVEIFHGLSTELFDKFIHMYNATMDKDNASEYYYFKEDFYESIYNNLKDNSLIFYAMYQNKIIAMSIIIFANQNMHYHLSASDREFQNLAPTNLLLYEAACWGSENGYKTFHLGGGVGSREDGLYKFKSSFNKNSEVTFEIGKKIFDNKKYNQLLSNRSLQSDPINGKYFPQYRG